MVVKKNITQAKKFWSWWHWFLITLILLALIVSSILSWHYITGTSMAGCDGGSPCDQVLGSRWSMIAGKIPVSVLAMGIYMALLAAVFFTGPTAEVSIRRLAWRTMTVLAGVIAGSAIWFTIIQKWIIGEFCVYCMTAHITGLFIAALIFWRAIKNNEIHFKRKTSVLILFIAGLIPVGMLAISQLIIIPSIDISSDDSKTNLTTVDYSNSPMVGTPDATYVVNLLFDYQCPHCQRLHFMLDEVVEMYDGKVAFALCPVPLNNQCNPYIPPEADAYKNSCELTRISLAVWLANKDFFSEFENWMFSFESGRRWKPRIPEDAKSKAIELVGQEQFENALTNPWIDEYIQSCVQMYGQTIQNGNRGVPRLVFGSNWVVPQPYNVDELISILQNNFSIK